MSKRLKIVVIVVIALAAALLLGFILWLLFGPKTPAPVPENPSAITVPVVLPQSSAAKTETTAQPAQNNLEVTLKALAATFAERYGSYSNQASFSNLKDLVSLMTLKLKTATDNYIASQPTLSAQVAYYGVTTKAVASKLLTVNETSGQAEVVVSTQRLTSQGSTVNPKVTYQDLKLQLVKTDDGWKVDSAAWQ